MGAVAAIIPILTSVASAVSTAYAVASTIDQVTGSSMVTKRPDEPDNVYSLGGPSYEDQTTSGQTPAQMMDSGFNNYMRTLAAISPSYESRHRRKLRPSYEQAVERKEQSQPNVPTGVNAQ